MAIQPFVSLTPSAPYASTYNAAAPADPHAYAYLLSYGGHTKHYSPYRIGDQLNDDQLIVGYNPVSPAELTISSYQEDIFERSVITTIVQGYNVSADNQFLFLFALNGISAATAQFFFGTEFIRAEEIAGDEQVAILVDSPGTTASLSVYIRLASSAYHAAMGFKGMDCFLL